MTERPDEPSFPLKEHLGFTIQRGQGSATATLTGTAFLSSRFLGITNGGQFCYSVTFDDGDGRGEQQGKVFVSLDLTTGGLTADY